MAPDSRPRRRGLWISLSLDQRGVSPADWEEYLNE
jgi:hypothetical protein